MKKWQSRVLLLMGLTIIALLAAVVTLVPAAAAYACSRCYGLGEAARDVYIETGIPDAERGRLLAELASAQALVARFYPERLAGQPVILACHSGSCDRRLGGKGAKARTFGTSLIVVSPGGWNRTILAHELAHIELHRRVGVFTLVSGALPAWFDEGLAVIVSRDRRYLKFDPDGKAGCKVADTGSLPETGQSWRRQAAKDAAPIYAMAACRVSSWLHRHGGPPAVIALARALRQGKTFRQWR